MKKEIVVENFRKSPSNVHHLVIDGDYKTLCGLNKNEDPGLWESQAKGDNVVCKNCRKALLNLKKEREKEDDCGCDGNCGDDCKCEKQEEIPFKNIISEKIAFVKKATSKTQHMAIKGSHKTLCGLTRKSSHLWEYQSSADNTLCKNCSKSYARVGMDVLNNMAEDLKTPKAEKELEEEFDTKSDEKKRFDKINNKNAYGFPRAPNEQVPYDMAKRRMELEERGFTTEEIKAVIYSEFFDLDMELLLEGDRGIPGCDPEFKDTIIGSTSRTDESRPDKSLGLNVDDHKEIFDELNSLHQKGVLPIDVIRKLFGSDVDSNINKVDRFINLMQSAPKGRITKETRQSGKEALEETFTEWKDGCISGNKKLLDHEFFYRIMKIQEILNKPRL